MTDDRDLDQFLGRLAEDGRDLPDPTEHPGDGTLSFYHARKLSPKEEDRVREHLVECKRCRDLLLEYAEFMEDEEEETPEGVADFGAAADWQRLRGVAVAADGAKRVDRAYEPGTPRSFFRSLKAAYSLAAVLALAVVGLSLYSVDLRGRLEKPELNLELYMPSSNGVARNGSGPASTKDLVKIPEGVDKVAFEIPVPPAGSYSSYLLEVHREAILIYREGGLRKLEGDVIRFRLPSSWLKPGDYRVVVFGVGKGRSEQLSEYKFQTQLAN